MFLIVLDMWRQTAEGQVDVDTQIIYIYCKCRNGPLGEEQEEQTLSKKNLLTESCAYLSGLSSSSLTRI